ncbi:Uncharacterized protein TCM_031747 [Theobroma cacao]|uniref:Uncharacterized protein n=1 Tax=Theobroma cacao TaxID=3641 RepID=A0A061F975_THECC|nr:Uncharacterized protein TCM_031747 [Theobroma cacao]
MKRYLKLPSPNIVTENHHLFLCCNCVSWSTVGSILFNSKDNFITRLEAFSTSVLAPIFLKNRFSIIFTFSSNIVSKILPLVTGYIMD